MADMLRCLSRAADRDVDDSQPKGRVYTLSLRLALQSTTYLRATDRNIPILPLSSSLNSEGE
ncbi:hypothetical protein N7449_005017 [Penicillium cf. viridicatum]|uniref:Uncharacterized protein n=1 Tax=Penicillium cf. viridicatum TaxID=2972119 RepID=A0A9W9SYM1_9EURO|nr:hypothetical protein N7449_005017 [Penicillium cf. viridicatum]